MHLMLMEIVFLNFKSMARYLSLVSELRASNLMMLGIRRKISYINLLNTRILEKFISNEEGSNNR